MYMYLQRTNFQGGGEDSHEGGGKIPIPPIGPM